MRVSTARRSNEEAGGWIVRVSCVGIALHLLGACGPSPAPEVLIPSWAKVAPEQISEAKRHGVPLAFENDLGMRFVLIPAGKFRFGDTDALAKMRPSRKPKPLVQVESPFYCQTTEVTNREFKHFRSKHTGGAVGIWDPDCPGISSLDGAEQPAVRVSHRDALDFAAWLSEKDESHSYDLPTSIQWEYACRAGTTTTYWWGEDQAYALANANILWPRGGGGYHHPHCGATDVGSFQANPWCLHDMEGNVREWCKDRRPTSRPRTPHYVVRGGDWSRLHIEMEVTYVGHKSQGGDSATGLRLVASLVAVKANAEVGHSNER